MLNKLFYRLGTFFFFLMLVVPTTYQAERGVLLLVLIAGGAYKAFVGKWKIHPSVLMIGICVVTTSLLFMLYGLFNDAPGAVAVGTVYVLWPLLFLFFMGVLNNPSDFEPFIKVIIVGVMTAALMAILLVAEGFGFIGLNISSVMEAQGSGLGIYEGWVEYNLYNMTTLLFGFPFLLALISLPKELIVFNKFWNRLALLALVLALITLLFSGRRIFWVVAAASPLIIFVIYKVSGLENPFKFKPLFSIVVIVLSTFLTGSAVFELSFKSILDDILAGFDFGDSSNLSAYARAEQFYALLHGWMDNPLFGSGHGAAAPGSIRSDEHPWAYELTYLALLFQIGLVGSLVYASALLWMFVKSIRLVRVRPEAAAMLLPLLVGLTGFLIANATNPYLAKFDYLWTIFLPIGILNAYLLRTTHGHSLRELERRPPTRRSCFQHCSTPPQPRLIGHHR